MPRRIIGLTGTALPGQIKTVNVVSSLAGFNPNAIKTETQLQPSQGGGTLIGVTGAKGLPTIFISGYTGPA